MSTELRPAEAGDVTLLLDLVRRLAEAQDAGGYVESTAEDMLRDGSGTAPRFHAVLAEQVDDATGAPTAVALTLYNFTYSTRAARPTPNHSDIYVAAANRGTRLGRCRRRRK